MSMRRCARCSSVCIDGSAASRATARGFIYLIALLGHVLRGKLPRPDLPMRTHAASFKTRYWKSAREYRHMSWNNVVLASAWT